MIEPDVDATTDPAVAAAVALHAELAGGERRLLTLEGDRGWGLAAACAIAQALGPATATWITDEPPPGISAALPIAKAAGLLGGECGLLIIDAHGGLDADALGAAAGTLRGGGLLLLLCPPLETWPSLRDAQSARIAVHGFGPTDVGTRFIGRLARLLDRSSACRRWRKTDRPPSRHAVTRMNENDRRAASRRDGPETSGSVGAASRRDAAGASARRGQRRAPTKNATAGGTSSMDARGSKPPSRLDAARTEPATADQQRAIEAVEKLARSRARRPLVLTADRGRGKSAALGIAAARLLAERPRQILVTAPRRSAAAALFAHAGAEAKPDNLRFIPPDALVYMHPPADLLLVDEAAAIPAPLLAGLLDRYGRITFATTVHGYEGSGRGFDVRFRAVLDARTPGWRELRMAQPIRWAAGDPLERLVDRALLLDAEPAADTAVCALFDGGLAPDALRIECLDRDCLADDETLLRQVFGLLVLGHYQTRPADLRMLLDAPNVEVVIARAARCDDTSSAVVLATALVAREGRLEEELLGPIFDGRRRPRGHLLPQTLSAHAGLYGAPRLGFARIVRIAVHPAAQGRGIGRRLTGAIAERGRRQGLDLIGASFGATAGLLAFWRRCRLEPVQLGTHRNAASGAHAVCVLQPLSRSGGELFALARRRLLPRLSLSLPGPLRGLEPGVAAAMIVDAPVAEPPLDAVERQELASFADADRALDAVLPALHRLALRELPLALRAGRLDERETTALVACILQRQDPTAAAPALGLPGQSALIRLLRHACARLLAGR